jgi:hypothetical protein
VRTEGHSYKVLDSRMYSAVDSDQTIGHMTPVEGLRFVVRAVTDFVTVPLPWQMESRQELIFLPQQLAWLLLVPLAIVGLLAGLRRDPLVTCLLFGVAGAGALATALNSGNVGTMIRHRDTVVPFVVWMSACGAVTLASAKARAMCR